MKKLTFNEFCTKYFDGLYEPLLTSDQQCTGYKQLLSMVKVGIKPATVKQSERWRNHPTISELLCEPHCKYLTFLHPLLRFFVIQHWKVISKLNIC